ncbi:MAG TPA: hypothetical protein VHJ40_07170 [Actinomycetota bacterium]|nr:hypothetical protein [Actinomycetota bacterium]
MRTIVAIALLIVLSSLLLSCGEQTNISPEASAILAPQVAGIRAAAADGDRGRASQHLNRLQTNVAELIRTGKLSEESARAILDAAAEVESTLNLIPPSPSPVRVEPRVTANPSSRFEDRKEQEDKGEKEGRGEDKDDDGNGKGDQGKEGSEGKEGKDDD